MIKDVWSSFPHLLENKINGLLDEADPKPLKAYHLYKTCLREDLWDGSFENFLVKISDFFHTPRVDRRKSQLDIIFLRPLHASLMEDFRLSFRTAEIAKESLREVASWASQIIRVSKKVDSPISSKEVLAETLTKITNPANGEKDENLEFEDFCEAWKRVVFKTYGTVHNAHFYDLLKELRWLKAESEKAALNDSVSFRPTLYLTQTEIDWVQAVEKALTFDHKIPNFPLRKGPQKPRLIDLERAIRLYRIVQTTQIRELLSHRENIRNTIFDYCQKILSDRAR